MSEREREGREGPIGREGERERGREKGRKQEEERGVGSKRERA
jgi:hypothetical protein